MLCLGQLWPFIDLLIPQIFKWILVMMSGGPHTVELSLLGSGWKTSIPGKQECVDIWT